MDLPQDLTGDRMREALACTGKEFAELMERAQQVRLAQDQMREAFACAEKQCAELKEIAPRLRLAQDRMRELLARAAKLCAEMLTPHLCLALEPPVFRLENGDAVGGVMVTNDGLVTAPPAPLSVELRGARVGQPFWEDEIAIPEEIPAGESRNVLLRIPKSALVEGLEAAYCLSLRFGSDSTSHQATLEIGQDIQIKPEAIPWDETREPGEAMFKGRDKELEVLVRHLKSVDRAKSCMLYGLTRMGKSSLLSFLARRIDLQPTDHPGPSSRFFCVEWNFAQAANNKKAAMWRRFLREAVVDKAKRLAEAGELPATAVPQLHDQENPDFDDWDKVLKTMRARQLYPVFLVDEFTYYKQMANSHLVEPSFLAAIRDFAIQGLASFIFAGTYDLRELLQEKKYGITGQLVNVEERRVSQIDEADARELIVKPMPELKFTEEAIQHILLLTFRIPYFVQLLCRRLALFATIAGHGRIGYPEVEQVVLSLIDDQEADMNLGIDPLGPNVFMNNMHHPQDPPHHHALLTTLCDHLRGQVLPAPLPLDTIKTVWQQHGVPEPEHLIARAVKELKDRQVLIEGAADGRPTYQISVDLFRRWWANEHRFLETDLDLLKSKGPAHRGKKAL